MKPEDSLQRCIALVDIAHHIPGRIRLKLNADVEDLRRIGHAGIKRLDDALDAVPGVRRVHLNKLARSIIVEYDNRAIPDRAWPDLLANRFSPEATALLNRLRDGYLQATDI
ncbi:MAG: cation transporter [Azoarcus sp.]|jgi:hypothetical protein|nr:cation transporter [Azoarcus sp.]